MTAGIDMYRFRVSSIVAHFVGTLAALSGHHDGGGRRDDEFLARVESTVEEHIADPCFTTAVAASCLAISRMHLNRRLRALTGQSTHEFIRSIRLNTAREILLQGTLPITVIAATVGFRSPSHFVEAFRERFGTTPARLRKLNHTSALPAPASHSVPAS